MSIMCKADVMSLARKSDVDRMTRRRLYTAVGELWDGAADCEWVALHGSEYQPLDSGQARPGHVVSVFSRTKVVCERSGKVEPQLEVTT